LLPLWRIGVYNFKYFKKGSFYTKAYILNKLEQIPLTFAYLPDGIKRQSLTINFLMTVSHLYNNIGVANGCA